MSEAEAKRFMDAIQADSQLRNKLEAMGDNPEAVYNEVISNGFDCTPEEIKAELVETASQTLSEDELASFAAGININWTRDKKTSAIIYGTLGGLVAVAAVAAI